ncbi:MAG: hypothetical protein JWP81_3792 [Ferruginibacter sp.]|nr:hypothetical protein [Ferruginibacter sp.]
MRLIVFFLAVSISVTCKAQEYNALLVPDSLRKGADVVKRYEEYILTIKSPSRYLVYEKHAYTILNAAARRYADYVTSYDKFCSINSVSGKLFNSMGKETKHSKKSDWKDNSAYDEVSLLSDARYKENEFYAAEYPYTVEFEEEDEFSGTQAFPTWMPQREPEMSVQHSKFTIIAPADYVVRYKPMNFTGQPVITQKGEVKTYTWELKNILAKKKELSAPSFNERTPMVFFAPSKFEVQGFTGDMSTWEGYGSFMYQLIKGRDVLPNNIKMKVHELTDAIKDDREKVYLLYDFLQKNTRYISVQLGIGGWQPFEATYVAEKKYGDCKALSNYMIALLKEAGITGKYVEIYGGNYPPPFIADFSCSQSNHVISCVPLNKDTIWLECTNQTVSPGYMGSFTGNRKALIIDETGGHLVQTPVYKVQDNLQVRIVKAVSDELGNVKADISNTYTGLQQDFPHSLMHDASTEEREKYLNRMFNLPTYQVIKNDYKEHKGAIPSVIENLQIQLNNYAGITGKRLYIAPNLFGSATEKLVPDTARMYDYLIRDAYRDIDSVEIKIPGGYKPESVPKDISLQTKFGKFASSTRVLDSETIVYYRMMEQYSGRFPAKEYMELAKFYDQVYRADRAKVVLVKPE